METPDTRLSRRRFMLAAAAGGAAGAAAVVVATGDRPGTAEGAATEPKKGYQVTEHVRNYYRTAKI